jgi:hypothetical protein
MMSGLRRLIFFWTTGVSVDIILNLTAKQQGVELKSSSGSGNRIKSKQMNLR